MDETEEINDLFDKLNILTQIKKKVNCCENEENYMLSDKITVCRICNSTISNLTTGAEWRFYGIAKFIYWFYRINNIHNK